MSSPDDGSSAMSRRGSPHRARPSSTSRQCPRLSAATGTSASSVRPDQVEHRVDVGELLGTGLAHVQQVLPQRPVTTPGPLGHDHVVAHRQLGEHLDALEGPPDPEPGPHVGGHVVEDVPVERHRPAARGAAARTGN